MQHLSELRSRKLPDTGAGAEHADGSEKAARHWSVREGWPGLQLPPMLLDWPPMKFPTLVDGFTWLTTKEEPGELESSQRHRTQYLSEVAAGERQP
ncbi:hypothetical protein [Cribrihabitans pelagius]|uniref:hypothetical protein n=1 Tax=Cribrihabitans pelagius TaxID=1765746 RepID=UPI003B5CB241